MESSKAFKQYAFRFYAVLSVPVSKYSSHFLVFCCAHQTFVRKQDCKISYLEVIALIVFISVTVLVVHFYPQKKEVCMNINNETAIKHPVIWHFNPLSPGAGSHCQTEKAVNHDRRNAPAIKSSFWYIKLILFLMLMGCMSSLMMNLNISSLFRSWTTVWAHMM